MGLTRLVLENEEVAALNTLLGQMSFSVVHDLVAADTMTVAEAETIYSVEQKLADHLSIQPANNMTLS